MKFKEPVLYNDDHFVIKIDPDKKHVLALIVRTDYFCDESKFKTVAKGIARAKGDDVFNEEDGIKLAKAKAYSNYLELDRKELVNDLNYHVKSCKRAERALAEFSAKKAKAKRVIAALKARM